MVIDKKLTVPTLYSQMCQSQRDDVMNCLMKNQSCDVEVDKMFRCMTVAKYLQRTDTGEAAAAVAPPPSPPSMPDVSSATISNSSHRTPNPFSFNPDVAIVDVVEPPSSTMADTEQIQEFAPAINSTENRMFRFQFARPIMPRVEGTIVQETEEAKPIFKDFSGLLDEGRSSLRLTPDDKEKDDSYVESLCFSMSEGNTDYGRIQNFAISYSNSDSENAEPVNAVPEDSKHHISKQRETEQLLTAFQYCLSSRWSPGRFFLSFHPKFADKDNDDDDDDLDDSSS